MPLFYSDALLNSAESRMSKSSDPWNMSPSWSGTTTSTMSRNTFSPPSQPLRPAAPEMHYKHPSPHQYNPYEQRRVPSVSPNYPAPSYHNARAGPGGYPQHPASISMGYNRPAYPPMPSYPAAPSYPAYAQHGGHGSRLDPHSAKFTPSMPVPPMHAGAMGVKGGNSRRAYMPLDGFIYQARLQQVTSRLLER